MPKGIRPVFLDAADSERLLSMLLALAAEVSVLVEEVDTLRELLAEAAVLAPGAAERRRTQYQALVRAVSR